MGKRKVLARRGRTLYIKNPSAHRLADELSKRTGMTLSDAVIRALENQIHKTPRPLDRAKVEALCARIGALPIRDPRSPDEILGYDSIGLPR